MAEEIGQPESIDWKEFLNSIDAEAPITCFSERLLDDLSMYLDSVEVVVQIKGLWPNWHGLADLIGFERMEISDIERYKKPGREVIERWKKKSKSESTVGNLVRHLLSLEREDILTDLGHKFMEEAKERFTLNTEVTSGNGKDECDSNILTRHDTPTNIARYDAFITYDKGDSSFVKKMISYLEPKGFKLCDPFRDTLRCGDFYEMMTCIISERCKYMIVVLSKNFIQNDMCRFQMSYAFSLNPGAKDKKVVPVKIEECPIPEPLRIMALCDFTHQDELDWSWERLERSIRRPMPNQKLIGPESWYSNSQGLSSSFPRLSKSVPSQSSRSSTSVPYQSSRPPRSAVPSQSSRSYVSERSMPEAEGRHRVEDSGCISGVGAARQATAYSSKHDPIGVGKSSGSQDPPSNAKTNVIKRLANFASSPKSKKKEKLETIKL